MICILTFNCFLGISKFSRKKKKTTTNAEVHENWTKSVCLCSKKVLGQSYIFAKANSCSQLYNTHSNKKMELVKTFWYQKQAFQQYLASGVSAPETASNRF